MKILYTITGLTIGGAETVTINLANYMQDLGHEVSILYLTGPNMQEKKINNNIKTISLHIDKKPISFIKGLYKAKSILKDLKPDVIHSNMFHSNVFFRLLRIFHKIPLLISTEHSKNIEGEHRMFIYRITDYLSDFNTNVSDEATNYFILKKAFAKHKSFTMYNGINTDLFINKNNNTIKKSYNITNGDFLFLNIGRLTQAKDHKNLIDAFDIFHSKHSNSKLLLVGDGELKNSLKQYVQNKGLNNSVIFAGSQSNVLNYYEAADCFVLSSQWEGFPTVLLEAMAMELPIITTTCGKEAILNDKYIVPINDSRALCEKMEQIYKTPIEQLKEIGHINRQVCLKFDISNICNKWEKIYNKIL